MRTLHYYDELGLLTPSEVTAAGYRLYGDDKLERLQQILFFRELDFPLREINYQRPERHEGDLPDRLPPQGLFPPCRNAGFHGLSTCGIGFSPGVCFLFQHPHHH